MKVIQLETDELIKQHFSNLENWLSIHENLGEHNSENVKEVKAKPPTVKVPTEREDTTTTISDIRKMAAFWGFIESSSLSKDNKDFLCKPDNLTMLYDLIEKSKGQDILGFQLKKTFGKTGEELYPFVSKNFCKLRAVLLVRASSY